MPSNSLLITLSTSIAILCGLMTFPLTAWLISLPPATLGAPEHRSQWILAIALGAIGLIAAMTSKRLMKS
jgi:hypothetical protein